MRKKQYNYSVPSWVHDVVVKFFNEHKEELLFDRIDSPSALVQAAVLEYIKSKTKEIADMRVMQKESKNR